MSTSVARWLMAASLLGYGAACVPASGGDTTGSGGKPATSGGSTGSSSGGSNGSGGSTGSGSGGKPATSGGSTGSGSGGSGSGSGGSGSGSGGSGSGSGGSSPTDGGMSAATFAYTFDSNLQGFSLNTYVPAAPQVNLAAPDGGHVATLTHDSTSGEPTPGAAKLTASFTDYRQFADVVIGPKPELSLTGKTIHAKVKLASGTWASGMGATLHASTGATAYTYGGGSYTSLKADTWTELTLDLSKVTTAMFDPTMVVQIGIQFYSGDPGEGGAFTPTDVTILIDSITDGEGGGTVTPPAVGYTFDTGQQGFSFNTYMGTGSKNLAAPDSGSSPTLTFDSAVGSPNPGSLKATVTFSGFQQFVDVVIGPQPALNLMGKVLKAKVRLTSGTFANGAGVTLHAGTDPMKYTYGGGDYTTLTADTWTDLTLDLSKVTTAMFDPTMVVQIGLQFYSGDPPEAGSFTGPNDVVFHIDTIVAE